MYLPSFFNWHAIPQVESYLAVETCVYGNIHPRRRTLILPINCRATCPAKHMRHLLRPKTILLQRPFAFGDGEAAGAGEEPSVAFSEADAAVARTDAGDFREFDAVFKGATVAVAMVGLQPWGWGGLRHCVCF